MLKAILTTYNQVCLDPSSPPSSSHPQLTALEGEWFSSSLLAGVGWRPLWCSCTGLPVQGRTLPAPGWQQLAAPVLLLHQPSCSGPPAASSPTSALELFCEGIYHSLINIYYYSDKTIKQHCHGSHHLLWRGRGSHHPCLPLAGSGWQPQ